MAVDDSPPFQYEIQELEKIRRAIMAGAKDEYARNKREVMYAVQQCGMTCEEILEGWSAATGAHEIAGKILKRLRYAVKLEETPFRDVVSDEQWFDWGDEFVLTYGAVNSDSFFTRLLRDLAGELDAAIKNVQSLQDGVIEEWRNEFLNPPEKNSSADLDVNNLEPDVARIVEQLRVAGKTDEFIAMLMKCVHPKVEPALEDVMPDEDDILILRKLHKIVFLIKQADLAEAVGTTRKTLGIRLEKLEGGGFVRRNGVGKNGGWRITEKGKNLLETIN